MFISVHTFDFLGRHQRPSESTGFKGKTGGSGWTRTTDLTLISRSFVSRNPLGIGFNDWCVHTSVHISPNKIVTLPLFSHTAFGVFFL